MQAGSNVLADSSLIRQNALSGKIEVTLHFMEPLTY